MRERTFFHDDGKPLWFIHESLLLAEGQDLLRRGKADEAMAMFQRATILPEFSREPCRPGARATPAGKPSRKLISYGSSRVHSPNSPHVNPDEGLASSKPRRDEAGPPACQVAAAATWPP
jgi:hypothetical protein